jgi:hypothetical protein
MREYITQWVRLCENICAPDKVVWCEEPLNLDETPSWESDRGVFVTPLADHTGSTVPTVLVTSLTELSLTLEELKGVLQDRTMYIVPYRTRSRTSQPGAIGQLGILVTDSPGTVNQFRRQSEVSACVWDALFRSETCVINLQFAFPSYRQSFVLNRFPRHRKSPAITSEHATRDAKPLPAHHEDEDEEVGYHSPFSDACYTLKQIRFDPMGEMPQQWPSLSVGFTEV